MKKTYELENEKQNAINKLIDLGVSVTATGDKIEYIEIDSDSHNITHLESMTGLKFKEKKEK